MKSQGGYVHVNNKICDRVDRHRVDILGERYQLTIAFRTSI